MLSPLKPLLCRHDFYWSERHLSERCRRCGKLRAAATADVMTGAPHAMAEAFEPAGGILINLAEPPPHAAPRSPAVIRLRARMLKAQALERRERLPTLLDRLAEGGRLTREEAIDAMLAVIEDAHSAEPLVFGADAAGYFARLLDSRSAQPPSPESR